MSALLYTRTTRPEYDGIQRESWSRIRHLAKSPQHYLHAIANPSERTPSMATGDAVHILALEPEVAAERLVTWEGGRRAGKEWEAFVAAAGGKSILTAEERATCEAMAKAVRSNPDAARYLSGGRAEVSILWEAMGIPLKSRLDYVSPTALVELKTTRDASLDGFGREVSRYRYHAQLALYADAYEAATGERPPVVIVAVESEAPHVVQCFRVGAVELEMGRREYLGLLETLALCRATNDWPGYGAGEVMLTLPRWAYAEEEAA